jgi:hypothetical protein
VNLNLGRKGATKKLIRGKKNLIQPGLSHRRCDRQKPALPGYHELFLSKCFTLILANI